MKINTFKTNDFEEVKQPQAGAYDEITEKFKAKFEGKARGKSIIIENDMSRVTHYNAYGSVLKPKHLDKYGI